MEIRRDGDPSRSDINQFGSLNYHFCFWTLRTLDVEPPRVDSCISPPPYILKKGRRAAVTWDEPVFSDNSRGVLNIHRTQADLKRFPVGTTLVKYTASDKYGNNATCTVKVVVKGILLFAHLFIYIYNNFRLISAPKLVNRNLKVACDSDLPRYDNVFLNIFC